eukprot:2978141-Ditylum_brightwellii.AAC.1
MGALNKGCDEGNGKIVGVIHEMFIVDGSDWCTTGAHSVFHTSEMIKGGEEEQSGMKRQILVAGGEDLQERKKLLVKGADALMVLPGGPGTWDELWEMACARNLGFNNIPIVCINTNGYYNGFQQMLQRGHDDSLLYNKPEDIVHFEDSAEKALEWVEQTVAKQKKVEKGEKAAEGKNGSSSSRKRVIQTRESALGGTSYWSSNGSKSTSWSGGKLFNGTNDDFTSIEEEEEKDSSSFVSSWSIVTFLTGIAVGVAISTSVSRS